MHGRLRLFTGDLEAPRTRRLDVTIRLAELTEVLSSAIEQKKVWVDDLADESIRVSADLYDVLCHCRRLKRSA